MIGSCLSSIEAAARRSLDGLRWGVCSYAIDRFQLLYDDVLNLKEMRTVLSDRSLLNFGSLFEVSLEPVSG
jgi:hypothetical protein